MFLPHCVICHEAFQLQHSRKICADVLGCGLPLSLGVSRFQFAAQAPIFGFKCFFGYGCFCFHFLHLYMFFAIGLLAFVSRRRCQRLCPFSFQHDIKRVSREKAQKKILLSFLIKKMYVQSWFSFTCTKFFFRPLTPFLYRATLIRAQAPTAKFSDQQQKRRSRFSEKNCLLSARSYRQRANTATAVSAVSDAL